MAISTHYIGNIKTVYQHVYFDHNSQQLHANNTLIVLNSKRLVELGPNYVQALHGPVHYNWAHSLVTGLSPFREAPLERVIGFARPASAN
ncbi:MAG: hypothetical protein ACO1NX_09175 [Chitinophagaceae bacterium]